MVGAISPWFYYFVGLCREHAASVHVRAPSTNVTESTQHILTSEAVAIAESQVFN